MKKPRQVLRPGDILTFPLGDHIRIIKVVALGQRRGPATEAQALYEDLSPPQTDKAKVIEDKNRVARREPGSGRPTKAERRALEKLLPEPGES